MQKSVSEDRRGGGENETEREWGRGSELGAEAGREGGRDEAGGRV